MQTTEFLSKSSYWSLWSLIGAVTIELLTVVIIFRGPSVSNFNNMSEYEILLFVLPILSIFLSIFSIVQTIMDGAMKIKTRIYLITTAGIAALIAVIFVIYLSLLNSIGFL